jgi:hypothetical protein
MDHEAEQLLVQFPGPIRFLLNPPGNRLVMLLDLIRMPLFFFLLVLTTSHNPGWLSWLPPWIVSFFLFGMVGMCLSWLFGWLSFRTVIWSTLAMFLVVEGSKSELKGDMFYFSAAALIVFAITALPGVIAFLADPGLLVLDQRGFEIKRLWANAYKVEWGNARNFAVGTPYGLVTYDDDATDDTIIGKIRRALGNPKPHLPSVEGFAPESLALFMTQWRERALNHDSIPLS